MILHSLMERLGEAQVLEGPSDAIASAIRPLFDPGPVKNALSGTWLGHRLHPLLTDVVIGALAGAAIIDVVQGDEDPGSADLLLAVGLGAGVPTALAGLSDWTDVYDRGRRLGSVHGAANVLAIGLSAASLAARLGGNRSRGRLLLQLALTALGAGGYMGGHLSYVMGIGVDHTAFHEGPKDWTRVARADEVTEEPQVVNAGERQVMLIRDGGSIVALDNRCSHAGQPIGGGEVSGGCITCPHHGSVFRLSDGKVVRGPAASPQPHFDVRVVDGMIELRGP